MKPFPTIEFLFAATLAVDAMLIMFWLLRFARKHPLPISDVPELAVQATYQTFTLAGAVLLLPFLALFDADNFFRFMTFGQWDAPAADVIWLGIRNESWATLGLGLAVFATAATGVVTFGQLRVPISGFACLSPYLPWIIMFSASNAFAEEVVFRLGILVPLFGKLDDGQIVLLSAIAFGMPHLRGMPAGLIGAAMAGLLGWLLAKSVIETGGVFWAWFLHFLQDIVIFSVVTMNGLANTDLRGSLRKPSTS